MNAHTPVLAARDAEDLQILSARLQDAVAKLGDLTYHARQHRFVGLFNRYKWESDQSLRVRSGLAFEGVLSVRCRNLKQGAPAAVVSLLAMRFTPNGEDDPGGTIELLFSGDGTIKLEVECLEASLIDDDAEWAALGKPEHDHKAEEKS